MNILFFIGNGFDVNLGMKTKYNDFYKHYQPIPSPNSLIQQLKQSISKNDIINWSDLEIAFGQYTKHLKTPEEFDSVFDDIQDNLAEYLQQIESTFDHSKIKKDILIKYLASPWQSLPPDDKNSLSIYRNQWSNSSGLHVNIITFNYTKSLEKILGYTDKSIPYSSIVLDKIEHIHGYTDNRMILGVNDTSQIANDNFHQNQNILETLVKSNCNQANKYAVEPSCKKLISKANLICIFGSSIGDTDNMWWELVGKQLKEKKDSKLIIFIWCKDNIPSRKEHKKERLRRKWMEFFLNKTKLTKTEREIVRNNIFIGINTDIFKMNNESTDEQ